MSLMSQKSIIISIPDSNFLLAEQLTQSTLICRHTVREILRKSQALLIDRYIENSIPLMVPTWALGMSEDTLSLGILMPDESMTERIHQGLQEDKEPISKINDCWRSFIANVDVRQHQLSQSSISHSKSHFSTNPFYNKRVSVKVEDKQAFKRADVVFQPFDPQLVDLSIAVEEDPLENGLRQNYEREELLRIQKLQAIQQRILERKEQQRQIRLMAASFLGDKAYTFDYEGKFMVQNIPKIEQLAPMQRKMQCEIKFEEKNEKGLFGKSFAKNEIKAEKIKTRRQEIHYQQKYESNLIESIQIAKGVTLYDGNQSKCGPSFHNDHLRHLNRNTLQNKLADPSIPLQLTKEEYETLVQGGIKLQLNQQSFDYSQFSSIKQQNSTIIPEQTKRRINSSMDSMVNGGSIRINNDNNVSVEELLVIDEKPILPLLKQKSKILIPNKDQQSPLKIGRDVLTQNKPKLPKVMNTQNSLPILPKNPRDRILSQGNLSNSNTILKKLLM